MVRMTAQPKPRRVKVIDNSHLPIEGHVVVSVPHNGTRTLVEALDMRASDQGLPAGRYWHFGQSNALLRAHHVHAHIPIRNPLDVAASWARRGKPVESMVSAYNDMFTYLDTHDEVTFHRIEDYEPTEGLNESKDGPTISTEHRQAVMSEVVDPHREFFERFYGDI